MSSYEWCEVTSTPPKNPDLEIQLWHLLVQSNLHVKYKVDTSKYAIDPKLLGAPKSIMYPFGRNYCCRITLNL